MTQEKIMKKRMIRAIVLFIITFIAMLVFIGLYIDETHRVQETYRRQYRTCLVKVDEDIESYLNGEGDLELRYSRIMCDMSSANSFAFLLDGFEENRKTVNELTSCLMKYPVQMKEKLSEMDTAVKDILNGLDEGYTEAAELVESIDKQGK